MPAMSALHPKADMEPTLSMSVKCHKPTSRLVPALAMRNLGAASIVSMGDLGVTKHGAMPMKTLTCKELGGKCDYKISAETWEEAVKKMTAHVMEKHADVANSMKNMHEEDPKKWAREMKPKWVAAPVI
jgi:predicted small metal-binding protein